MPKTTSSLTKFGVKPIAAVGVPSEGELPRIPVPMVEASSGRKRGTNRRVGIAVRLGHDDWYRLHDLAVRDHQSLQGLIVSGLNELMKQRGLPPLSGR